MSSPTASVVRGVLRRAVKPKDRAEDLVASIRRSTDRRPPPTFPARDVSRRTDAGTEVTTVASPERHVVYLHGGYHIAGGPALYRNLASKLSSGLQAAVHVLDLPLAPEHPYPAALQRATADYHRLVDSGVDSSTVAIAGDSAGGGLALALLQRIRAGGLPLPGAGVLISPWLDLSCSGASINTNDNADAMLSATALRTAATLYAADRPLSDPGVSPLFGSLDGLPPLYVTVDTSETLLDDSRRLVERTSGATRIDVEEQSGLFHIWPVFTPFVREARDTVANIVTFLRQELV